MYPRTYEQHISSEFTKPYRDAYSYLKKLPYKQKYSEYRPTVPTLLHAAGAATSIAYGNPLAAGWQGYQAYQAWKKGIKYREAYRRYHRFRHLPIRPSGRYQYRRYKYSQRWLPYATWQRRKRNRWKNKYAYYQRHPEKRYNRRVNPFNPRRYYRHFTTSN